MEHQRHKTLDLIKHIVRIYPGRTTAVALLLVLSGLVEGVGVMSLLPLLEVGLNPGNPSSPVTVALANVLAVFGLQPTFGAFLAVVVLGISGKALLMLLASKEVGYAVAGVMTDLRIQVLKGVFRSKWRYISTLESGRLANAIGIEALRAASVFNAIAQLFALLVQVLIYAIAVALVSWQAAIAGFLCSAVAARVLHKYVRQTREAGRAQTELLKTLSNRVTEMLLSIKSVKAMGCEDRLVDVLVQNAESLNHTQRRQILAAEALRVMQEPLAVGVLAAGLYLFVIVAGLPLASMMVTAVLFYRLLNRLGTVQQNYQTVVAGESAFWSLKAVAEQADLEREFDQGGVEGVFFREKISVSNIRFSYGDKQVIRGATFEVAFGEYVCIRGESGAGKSTFGDLVLRLIEPSAGEICIDGRPLAEFGLRAWRSQIGYVPQEPGLFGGSIFENIVLGDPSFTKTDVRQALVDAGAWNFVQELPLGMDSELGDRGSRLSGGQKQRIAIARALVRKPRLLILDEVTSSLDPLTEAGIIETLRNLRGKVTILAISHQQSVADAADRELVMENGCVGQFRPAVLRAAHA